MLFSDPVISSAALTGPTFSENPTYIVDRVVRRSGVRVEHRRGVAKKRVLSSVIITAENFRDPDPVAMQAYQTLGCQSNGSSFNLQNAGGFYGQSPSPYSSQSYSELSDSQCLPFSISRSN